MVLALERNEVNTQDLPVWDLPEKLPGNPNVSLRSLGDFSGLTEAELTRVNFGVTEAARVIFEGGGAKPGFGYTVEARTRNVYSVVHRGTDGQRAVEGLVIRRGSIYKPEIILFQAGRVNGE